MNLKIIITVFWLGILFWHNVYAAPAAPLEFELTQPDGSTFTARARGDEYSNWTETSEGHTVVKLGDSWFYAEKDNAGELRASSNQVGTLTALQKLQLPKHLAPAINPADLEPVVIRKISRGDSVNGLDQPQTISHTQYVLTILVNYDAPGGGTDTFFSYSDASFQALMYGASNSVKHFFLENSYSGFALAAPNESYGTANDGVIHVTRPVAHPNQGGTTSISRTEARAIVQLTDPYINYASFDTDNNGAVSADELSIVIITAGYETAYGGTANALTPNVWGHKSSFNSLTLDGKTLAPYTMFGERHGTSSGTHQATIGIMCHELGHLMLGLPDLYDTDGSSAGIGDWGLMASGSWNKTGSFSGDKPAHLSAWSKVATNFTIPQDIDTNQNSISIAQAESNEVAKRVWADKYKSELSYEYFLVENRQKTGFDAGLPAAGLLIWHIDESRSNNATESHKWVDLEEADGLGQLDAGTSDGDSGDPFPGSANKTLFDNASNPNSKDYAAVNTGIGVTSISTSGANMTADFASLTGGVGGHVRYDEKRITSLGYNSKTGWIAINVLNDTGLTNFDGVDVYVTDPSSAVVDIYYYTSMAGGTPTVLIHSQTGIAAVAGWNRLLLNTPQSFPALAERGVVLKIVNSSYNYPMSVDTQVTPSGRSYYDSDGAGTFSSMASPCSFCGGVNLIALLSAGSSNTAPAFTPAAAIARQQGSAAGSAVAVGTVNDAESANGSLVVTQIGGGTATGITVSGFNNSSGNVTAMLAASCSATTGTVRFQVSDGGLTGTGDLQLNVTANSLPTLTYGAKSINFSAASTHAAATGPADNGSVSSVSVQSSGTYTGSISVNPAGQVSLSNAQPVGTHTITIRATDNCGSVRDATFQLQVNAVVPGAPAIGTATGGNAQASVTFTPPGFNGGAVISSYTATASPGNLMGVGEASPITVLGLTNGQAYTFTVTATNPAGTGSASAASNPVTPIAPQTLTFDNPGSQDFGTSPTLSATASSSLPVTFTSTTQAVCTITLEGVLTFLTTGNCSIDANQAGNAAYEPAPQVNRSFDVNAVVPGAPMIGSATAGNAEATVSFTPPGANGGAAITSYTVTSNPGNLTGVGAASPIVVSGLTNGQAYTFTVTATNSAGTGPSSAPSDPVTPAAEVIEEIFNSGFE